MFGHTSCCKDERIPVSLAVASQTLDSLNTCSDIKSVYTSQHCCQDTTKSLNASIYTLSALDVTTFDFDEIDACSLNGYEVDPQQLDHHGVKGVCDHVMQNGKRMYHMNTNCTTCVDKKSIVLHAERVGHTWILPRLWGYGKVEQLYGTVKTRFRMTEPTAACASKPGIWMLGNATGFDRRMATCW